MTVTLHHLEHSRSIRVLWLFEELGLDFEMRTYHRDANFRAPTDFASMHPLGRSPVVEVDGHVLAESGAIIEYFVEREGKLRPAHPAALLDYRFFLHYAEGSTMTPLVVQLIVEKMRAKPVPFFIKPIISKIASELESSFSGLEIEHHFSFVNDELEKRAYFAGDEFSAADVQMLYPVEAALSRKPGDWPAMFAWRERVKSRPAYQRAELRGGAAVPSPHPGA